MDSITQRRAAGKRRKLEAQLRQAEKALQGSPDGGILTQQDAADSLAYAAADAAAYAALDAADIRLPRRAARDAASAADRCGDYHERLGRAAREFNHGGRTDEARRAVDLELAGCIEAACKVLRYANGG